MESWDHITRIHGILIFDEAKAIHELDLLDASGAMSTKQFLHILFCDWKGENESQRLAMSLGMYVKRIQVSEHSYPAEIQYCPESTGEGTMGEGEHTVARKVAQIEPGGGDVGHGSPPREDQVRIRGCQDASAVMSKATSWKPICIVMGPADGSERALQRGRIKDMI
jgi:hypothetical protein